VVVFIEEFYCILFVLKENSAFFVLNHMSI